MKSDRFITIQYLKAQLKQFRDERDWARFHDPKNLAEAISIEAGELLELFLWKTPSQIETEMSVGKELKSEVERELADVFCFSLNLANYLNLDVASIVLKKIRENKRKYPVTKSKGKATKYTKL